MNTGAVHADDLPADLIWVAASLSGNCVEVARYGERIALRHSRHPRGMVLVYSMDEWRAFKDGVARGEFDALDG